MSRASSLVKLLEDLDPGNVTTHTISFSDPSGDEVRDIKTSNGIPQDLADKVGQVIRDYYKK